MHLTRIAAIVLVAALSSCSGSGGNASVPTQLPSGTSQPSSGTTATQSYELSTDSQQLTIPAVTTCNGRVMLPPGSSVASGTVLTVTTSTTAPNSFASSARTARPQTAGSLNFLCYVTFAVSNSVTYSTLPGFTVTVAPTISTASPQQFFYALSDPTVTNVALSFRTEGPATVQGQTLTFASAADTLTLIAHRHYTFAFYGTAAPVPSSNATGMLYASSTSTNSISVFDIAHGYAPQPTISGGGLDEPEDIAVDATGKLYAANFDSNAAASSVSVFDTAHGNAALPRITGGGLSQPFGVAVDASGKLYVGNPGNNTISVFDTLHGNAPLPSIVGGGVSFPDGLAIDASGKLYVSNFLSDPSSVSVFDTVHGNTALTPITGGGLSSPRGLAIDASGKLYVANVYDSVSVFDTAHGNAPLQQITGNGLSDLEGVALDSTGRLYVATGNQISVFDTTRGDAALTAITGGGIGLAVH